MASLYQRSETITSSNGTEHTYDYWIAEQILKDGEGKRIQVRGRGRTPRQANQRLRNNVQKRLEADRRPNRRRGGITTDQYLDRWLEQSLDAYSIKPQTAEGHRRRYRKWASPHIGSTPLEELTPDTLKPLLRNPELVQAGPSAVEAVHKTLRALLNHAVKNEVLKTNPMNSVSTPKARSKVNEEDIAHADKRATIARYLIRWLKNPDCPYHENYPLIFAMFLGLRRAETLGITWDCFHQRMTQLEIKQQLIRRTDGTYFIQPDTKTKQPRTLILPKDWIAAFKLQRDKKIEAQEEWAQNLVFLTKDGKTITYAAYNKIWHETLEAYMTKDGRKLHETDTWRPHSNRKITASLLASQGVSPQIAQTILGHRSEAMTHYYTTISKQAQKDAMNAYSEVF